MGQSLQGQAEQMGQAPDGGRGEGGHEVKVFPAFSNAEGMKATSSANLSDSLSIYRTKGINENSDGSYK